VILLMVSVTQLAACEPDTTPAVTPTINPTESPSASPTASPGTTTPTAAPSKPTSEVPLNVTLYYAGVRNNLAGETPADIYFLTVISDGYARATQQFLPVGGTCHLDTYDTVEFNDEIFITDSAGDSLKVCILAYKQNDPQWRSEILEPALAEIQRGLDWGDYRSAEEILTTVDSHQAKSEIEFINGGDTLIGYFEDVWGKGEDRGIGQYRAVGTDDLRLWFSIWSEEAPKTPSLPTLLPAVELEDLNMVATASAGFTRTDIVRLHNSENHALTVTLEGTSELAGQFYNEPVTLEAGGYAWIENEVDNPNAGLDTIGYRVYFRETELDKTEESLRVIADKRLITLVEWRNSDGSTPINKNILDGTPVTLYVEAPGYTGVTFSGSLRIVEPDGTYQYEQTIPINIINGAGMGHWKANWQAVLEGDPTYVFGVKSLFSNELTVVKKYQSPPAVSFESVDLVPYVETDREHAATVNITNEDEEVIVIRLKGISSDSLGEFYNKAISLPAGATTSFSVPITFTEDGIKTITYELYFQGISFDSWSEKVEVF
jgi:hypothetical protein